MCYNCILTDNNGCNMSGIARNVTISSLDQLSLDDLILNKERLNALPKNIYNSLCDAFSKVVQSPQAQPLLSSLWDRNPACIRVENRRIFIYPKNGFLNPLSSLPTSDFPTLEKAIGKTRDAARRRMPEAFLADAASFNYQTSETRPNPDQKFSVSKTASIGISIGIDINSVFRNAFSASGKAAGFIPISAAAGGSSALYVGISGAIRGLNKSVQAAQCGDKQGLADGVLLTASSLTYVGVGSGMLFGSEAVATPLHISQSTTGAFGALADWSGLAMYGFIMIDSINSYNHIRTFRNDLNDILERKGVSAQKKAEEGLLFLQQQIGLTESDLRALQGKPLKEHEKRLQEKWDRFVRRVGANCSQKVALHSAKLLTGVRRGNLDEIHQAIKLLEMADKGSHQQMISQLIFFLISVLGIIASVLSITEIASISSSILFAVSGALWLLVDSPHISNIFTYVTFQGDSENNHKKRWDLFSPLSVANSPLIEPSLSA